MPGSTTWQAHVTDANAPGHCGSTSDAAVDAGAVAVALIALHRPATHRLERAVEPLLSVLHRLYSGNVGDYVAWTLLGIAALGALVVLTG